MGETYPVGESIWLGAKQRTEIFKTKCYVLSESVSTPSSHLLEMISKTAIAHCVRNATKWVWGKTQATDRLQLHGEDSWSHTQSHTLAYTWAWKKKIRKIKTKCLLDLGYFTSRNNRNSPEIQEKSKLFWVKFLIPLLPRYFVLMVAPPQKTIVEFWVYNFPTPNLSNHIMYYTKKRSLSRETHPRPDIISGRMSLETLTPCYL